MSIQKFVKLVLIMALMLEAAEVFGQRMRRGDRAYAAKHTSARWTEIASTFEIFPLPAPIKTYEYVKNNQWQCPRPWYYNGYDCVERPDERLTAIFHSYESFAEYIRNNQGRCAASYYNGSHCARKSDSELRRILGGFSQPGWAGRARWWKLPGSFDELLRMVNPNDRYSLSGLALTIESDAEKILWLNPSIEQLRELGRILNLDRAPTKAHMALLRAALNTADNADEFFEIFNALLVPDPSEEYLGRLAMFFRAYKDDIIMKLYPSNEQKAYLRNCIPDDSRATGREALWQCETTTPAPIRHPRTSLRTPAAIMDIAKNSLDSGDLDAFIGHFDTLLPTPFPRRSSEILRNNALKRELSSLVSSRSDSIMLLNPSTEQLRRLGRVLDEVLPNMSLLRAALKTVKNADGFVEIFNTLVGPDPSVAYRRELIPFLRTYEDDIMKLGLSEEQMTSLKGCIQGSGECGSVPTLMVNKCFEEDVVAVNASGLGEALDHTAIALHTLCLQEESAKRNGNTLREAIDICADRLEGQ